jgi:hypothetical protein
MGQGLFSSRSACTWNINVLGPEPLRGASFFCEVSLRQLIKGHEATLKRRLEQSADLDSFLTELKVFLEGRITVSA